MAQAETAVWLETSKEKKDVGFRDLHVTNNRKRCPFVPISTVAHTEEALLVEIDQVAVRLEERHAERSRLPGG